MALKRKRSRSVKKSSRKFRKTQWGKIKKRARSQSRSRSKSRRSTYHRGGVSAASVRKNSRVGVSSTRKYYTGKRSLRPTKFVRRVSNAVLANAAPHVFVTKTTGAAVSWAINLSAWVETTAADAVELIQTMADAITTSTVDTSSQKLFHMGTKRIDKLLNMGSLPFQVDVWELTARDHLPYSMLSTDEKNTVRVNVGTLMSNDATIYAATGINTTYSATPFDFPSVTKYFKIRQVYRQKIVKGGGELKIVFPEGRVIYDIDPRGLGALNKGATGGSWFMKKGQVLFMYHCMGIMGPDETFNTLKIDPVTGYYSATDALTTGGGSHISRAKGRVTLQTSWESVIKQQDDIQRSVILVEDTPSTTEPKMMLPMQFQRGY